MYCQRLRLVNGLLGTGRVEAITGSCYTYRTFSVSSFRYQNTPLVNTQAPAAGFKEGDKTIARHPIRDRLSLSGRTTVVTGGARGIGLALVEAAAEFGSNVAILDVLEKPKKDLSELQTSFGIKAQYYRTDVTEEGVLGGTFDQIAKDFGRIDNCVTAAGIVVDKPFMDHQWDESERLLKVNVLGTFFCAQYAAKKMREQGSGGSIVMIASIASHMALPQQHLAVYSASKGAVRILMKNLAVEMAPFNIRFNTISPGYIRSDMTDLCASTAPELYKTFSSAPPLGRIGEPDDITAAVTYLLSDASAYTTGADIPITGGLIGGRITS